MAEEMLAVTAPAYTDPSRYELSKVPQPIVTEDTDVGKSVKTLKVGDEVYTRLPEVGRGAWSEYAKCSEEYVALKPKTITFGEAASLPLAAVTALQVLRQYKGSLEGKTVFIPAGWKVITTVSTTKIPKVPELLGEGVVDQIIDYTKADPLESDQQGWLYLYLQSHQQQHSKDRVS
ncbi:hypothetical protein TrVFT333_006202 [Trichoderma virens FT-333]|nr:hypothetical protein TrVFT333_006202 [Trichoderma virens FT-333]